MANRITICGFALFALVSVASAQVNCYQCSFYYTDSTTVDSYNCGTVSSSSTTVVPSCSGSCYTEISLDAGDIYIDRGCELTTTQCNDCTDLDDCKICCDTNNCNSDSLSSILSSKALTQTCYKCSYSEIPGVHSDAGCGLDFDATSAAVHMMECPGMCFSSKSLIPGVEDILRGCSYFGNECDYENDEEVVRPVRNSVQHRYSCCMGDNCNHATSPSVGLAAIIIGAILGIMV